MLHNLALGAQSIGWPFGLQLSRVNKKQYKKMSTLGARQGKGQSSSLLK